MRVKVGDTWYSPTEQPIMIELTEADKFNIMNMPASATKYAMYDDHFFDDRQLAFNWMDDKLKISN